MAETATLQDATSKAKTALGNIGKEGAEPGSFEKSLNEAKAHLDRYVNQLKMQAGPSAPSVQQARYSIDKIALVRGNPDNIKAAVKDAEEELDKLAKQEADAKK